jgi:hypothetical protein
MNALFAIVFGALVAAEIYGLATGHLFAQPLWFPAGLRRFEHFTGGYLALAGTILLVIPWSFVGLMGVLLLALTAISVGALPLLAVVYFLVSCWALGRLIGGTAMRPLISMLLGLAAYMFLMTLLARVPVHHAWVWIIVLSIPIAAQAKHLPVRTRIQLPELRTWSERAAFALLAYFVVAHWFVALKPEISYDGLAMHLAVPMNIALHHALTYEPGRFLWSVMPMGADWAWSIVYLLGGEYADRILTFAMLLVALALLYEMARRWLSPAAAMLITALFACTPLVQFVTGSMFVENFVAALVLGFVAVVWDSRDTGGKRLPYAAAILAGAALNVKLGTLAFLIPVAPFLIARTNLKRAAAACALFIATAAPTYAIAWFKTGNPIFPFNNRKIHSPLLDPTVDVNDGRYRIPIGPGTLYHLTFRSSDVYEGQDGSLGFQYFVIVPLGLIGLFVLRNRPAAMAAVMAAAGSLLILLSQPNIRYLYAGMPLALIAFAGLLAWIRKRQVLLFRALVIYLLACTGLNAWFLSSANYYHKEFSLRVPFSRAERDRYRAEAVPVRTVFDYFNQHHRGSAVLLAGPESILAGLDGDVYINNWHQYPTVQQLKRAYTLPDMLRLLRSWNIAYFIVPKASADVQIRPIALKSVIERCAKPEFIVQGWYLARFEPDCNVAVSLVAAPGYYDDFDPVITYRGDWDHDDSFSQPSNHTVSYTDTPGSEISLTFEGKGVTYGFTKAPNRGIAAITVDGLPQRTVDLYSPNIEWQSQKYFCCFPAGHHILAIRVTGESNPASTGKFVDVDFFNVQ